MKYLLLTEGAAYFPELLKPFERAGLYNWMRVFNGEIRLWGDIKKRKSELCDYDIIHINSYGQDIGLAAKIEQYLEGSKTKLIVNMDLSVNYFDKDMHLRDFIADIHAADLLFSVEPTQVNLINYLAYITKRKKKGWATLMPHPVNIPMLIDKAWVDYDKRMNIVAFQYHKYDGQWEIPRMLMVNLPTDWFGAMMGYTKESINMEDMPHMVMPFQEWDKYIHFLARCKIGFEYRTHKAASRFVMEAGALGIPVITTKDSHMGQLIFPEICFEVGDYMAIRAAIEKLIADEEYRLKLARDGLERLEPYNFENSKKKMLEVIK